MAKAQKYSRILESAKYYSAIDNYIKYITDASKRGQNVGNGKARQPSQRLFIDPFNIALAAGQVVPTSAAEPTWTKYNAAMGAHTGATAPGDENLIVKVAEFTPARVVIATGRSNTGVAKTSKVTGLKYLDYGGTSTSVPFGRATAAETMTAAFDAIKTAIVAQTAGARVTLTPEKF
jgi:hypothetical protein